MTPPLETRRLLLRPLELIDAEQTQPLFAQWEIVRYLNGKVPWPYPEDGAATYYRDVALPQIERGELWMWSIRLKTAPGQLIGAISLMRETDNNRGFWIGKPWQGNGYATEASDAVAAFWFDELGFPVLRIPKAIENTASRRISEKSGMRVIATEDRDYVAGRLPAETWEITAEEWKLRRR